MAVGEDNDGKAGCACRGVGGFERRECDADSQGTRRLDTGSTTGVKEMMGLGDVR